MSPSYVLASPRGTPAAGTRPLETKAGSPGKIGQAARGGQEEGQIIRQPILWRGRRGDTSAIDERCVGVGTRFHALRPRTPRGRWCYLQPTAGAHTWVLTLEDEVLIAISTLASAT